MNDWWPSRGRHGLLARGTQFGTACWESLSAPGGPLGENRQRARATFGGPVWNTNDAVVERQEAQFTIASKGGTVLVKDLRPFPLSNAIKSTEPACAREKWQAEQFPIPGNLCDFSRMASRPTSHERACRILNFPFQCPPMLCIQTAYLSPQLVFWAKLLEE